MATGPLPPEDCGSRRAKTRDEQESSRSPQAGQYTRRPALVGRSKDARADSTLSLTIEKRAEPYSITSGANIEDPDTATPVIDLSAWQIRVARGMTGCCDLVCVLIESIRFPLVRLSTYQVASAPFRATEPRGHGRLAASRRFLALVGFHQKKLLFCKERCSRWLWVAAAKPPGSGRTGALQDRHELSTPCCFPSGRVRREDRLRIR